MNEKDWKEYYDQKRYESRKLKSHIVSASIVIMIIVCGLLMAFVYDSTWLVRLIGWILIIFGGYMEFQICTKNIWFMDKWMLI